MEIVSCFVPTTTVKGTRRKEALGWLRLCLSPTSTTDLDAYYLVAERDARSGGGEKESALEAWTNLNLNPPVHELRHFLPI